MSFLYLALYSLKARRLDITSKNLFFISKSSVNLALDFQLTMLIKIRFSIYNIQLWLSNFSQSQITISMMSKSENASFNAYKSNSIKTLKSSYNYTLASIGVVVIYPTSYPVSSLEMPYGAVLKSKSSKQSIFIISSLEYNLLFLSSTTFSRCYSDFGIRKV